MPRKIFIDPIETTMHFEDSHSCQNSIIEESESDTYDLLSYAEILKATIQQFPKKMLFNMKETAEALCVSVEFIRKRISEGKINAVCFGDRKLISINELARLIQEGV